VGLALVSDIFARLEARNAGWAAEPSPPAAERGDVLSPKRRVGLAEKAFDRTPVGEGDRAVPVAAGPLEVLLSEHGPDFIDRVETEAAHNNRFREALTLVWRLEMTDDVWTRVQKAREQPRTI